MLLQLQGQGSFCLPEILSTGTEIKIFLGLNISVGRKGAWVANPLHTMSLLQQLRIRALAWCILLCWEVLCLNNCGLGGCWGGETPCFFLLLLLACPRLSILESCSLNLSLNNETDEASSIALVRESADRMHSFKVPSVTVIEITITGEQTNLCTPT